MEHLFGHLNIRDWPPSKTVIVAANENYSLPLSHVHSFLCVKPLNVNFKLDSFMPSSASLQQVEKLDGHEYWNRFGKYSEPGTLGNFQLTDKSVHWKDVVENNEIQQETRSCFNMNNNLYKLLFSIRKEPYPSKDTILLPGHTITLLPPLRVHNLLPCDLLYKLQSGNQGRISASNTANIHEIDLDQQLEIVVTLDSYPGAGQIVIQSGTTRKSEMELKLSDTNGRILILKAWIQSIKGSGMQISISAPFWLVNRTGLPLMFRQESVTHEFAGQFSENEQARMVSPLMFSFSDQDVSMALVIRLGKRYGSNLPVSSKKFN